MLLQSQKLLFIYQYMRLITKLSCMMWHMMTCCQVELLVTSLCSTSLATASTCELSAGESTIMHFVTLLIYIACQW